MCIRDRSDLVLYATGAAACSTSDLLMVLETVNKSLDSICLLYTSRCV